MSASENLKKWFQELPDSDKREVLQFLYGGKALLSKGVYLGPQPGLVERGLYVGPAPSSSSSVCSQCGRPL
jgi:hypothetical protein